MSMWYRQQGAKSTPRETQCEKGLCIAIRPNRLLEEQMSAISQSVQLIQAAIKTHAKVVSLLGREITVNHNAGIFITMNPATRGYGG